MEEEWEDEEREAMVAQTIGIVLIACSVAQMLFLLLSPLFVVCTVPVPVAIVVECHRLWHRWVDIDVEVQNQSRCV